jgi:haloalkane dehalogenase
MAKVYRGLDVRSDQAGRFPFKSTRVDVGGGVKMAVVDEGPRDAPLTILLLHGNPTWGYLYRKFIPHLATRFRVVVPDHVGFGRSDKPHDPSYYTLERHIQNLEALVKRLKLHDLVPVVQDWAGPIGMGMAVRNPKLIRGVVVLNTWAFVERPVMELPWFFRFLVLGRGGWRRATQGNFYTEKIVRRNTNLDRTDVDAYRAPHPRPEDRAGIGRFAQLIPQTHDTAHESWQTMKRIEDALATLSDRPALIVWAMKDIAFRRGHLERWLEVFPDHDGPHRLPDATHYLQEDAPDEILARIDAFLDARLPRPASRVRKAQAPAPTYRRAR